MNKRGTTLNPKEFPDEHYLETCLPIDLFCLASQDEYWPQRLLHIPSMTSVERQGLYSYQRGKDGKTVDRPQYCCLSYTWGRFERAPKDPNHGRLAVASIDWDIPAIEESHFTAGDFKKAVKQMGNEYQFAWIDVACIHQTNISIKMQEINQQGKIFALASRVFVWMSETPTECLQDFTRDFDAFLEGFEAQFMDLQQGEIRLEQHPRV